LGTLFPSDSVNVQDYLVSSVFELSQLFKKRELGVGIELVFDHQIVDLL